MKKIFKTSPQAGNVTICQVDIINFILGDSK
jgi:hypothetical protein